MNYTVKKLISYSHTILLDIIKPSHSVVKYLNLETSLYILVQRKHFFKIIWNPESLASEFLENL